MGRLIKASLIASIVTIGGNMEQELLIKLDWNKIEKDFCMTEEQYVQKTGDEYGYNSNIYYIEGEVFRGVFSDYVDGLVVKAGGIPGMSRKYDHNHHVDGGDTDRDDLFSYFRMGQILYLDKGNKDKFEATVNKMLSDELSKLKDDELSKPKDDELSKPKDKEDNVKNEEGSVDNSKNNKDGSDYGCRRCLLF